MTLKKISTNKSIGFVPTMGALHDGHLSLVKQALATNDVVVVSIYVNPEQFAPNEDFDAYPRQISDDIDMLMNLDDAIVVWQPSTNEIYPEDDEVSDDIGPRFATQLCGITRPHFFEGVCKVVHRLLLKVSPTRVYFGEKDFQQLRNIQCLVEDLGLDVDVVGCPLVRDRDGLALSSRNQYLSAKERELALGLPKGLFKMQEQIKSGKIQTGFLKQMFLDGLSDDIKLDYISIVDPETLLDRYEDVQDGDRVCAAIQVGETRLVDNLFLNVM